MKTKTKKYNFKGLNRDINPGSHPEQYLFDANNIRYLSTTESISGGAAFEKGNVQKLVFPTVTIGTAEAELGEITYGSSILTYVHGGEIDGMATKTSSTQTIIGYTVTRDAVVLFSTDDSGMDCIWTITNGTYTLELKYVRDLGFSTASPIQAIFNYENENIQKIYWVDGVHQIRFLNLNHGSIEGNSNLIDIPSNSINFVGVVDFSQPTVTSIGGGGVHTAGMVQYAYNLFRLNNSQTKISPLSELVPLARGQQGGGDLNDVVGAAPVVQIDNIDSNYTHIQVYAIKYTSLNQIPSISLIEERELSGQTSITLYDDGSTISTLSLEEFLFLGSDPQVPKHIETKDNSLFLLNVQERSFVLPDELDTRCYSFPISSTTTYVNDSVHSGTGGVPTGDLLAVTNTWLVPPKHDAVNLIYDTYKYQYNNTTFGGEGIFFKYEININPSLTKDEDEYRFFKDREVYRIGIQFYNRLGQTSLPKWIADFKSPATNLEGNYGTLKVTVKAAFTSWLASYPFLSPDDIPVGYRIIRADRTLVDKTIICQGMLSSMMVNSPRHDEGAELFTDEEKRNDSEVQPKMPSFLSRTFQETVPLKGTQHIEAMQWYIGTDDQHNPLTEIQYDHNERKADTYQYTAMMQMYSPEIQFGDVNLNSSIGFNVIGGGTNTENNWWGQARRIASTATVGEAKALDKLSSYAPGGTNIPINGNIGDLMDRGLISNTNGEHPDENVEFNQWYREFGALIPATGILQYQIYGTPELTQRGQGRTIYNNNSKYEYTNTLEGFLTDGEDEFDDDGMFDRTVLSLNSYGAQCVTFVGDWGSQTDDAPDTRPKLENIHASAGIGDTNCILLSEFVRPAIDIYLGAIYGGNTYEDKKRTTYIEIGAYQDIASTEVQIDSPGDTYVQLYRFLRIGKTDQEIYSSGINQITEIISVKLETAMDLKNRNDTSVSTWDSDFQPRYDGYHNYNTVYNQQATLVENTALDFTFRRISNFDTRIQASKTKIPNETVDSWTDVLTNELIDLDGKYGPINGVVSFKDNLYTFQDTAFALISINPRVQNQGTDGISIELGTGGKLHDYTYISTKAGSLNKWGILATEIGLYFLDGLNKRFHRFSSKLEPLSETKGFHGYLESNLDITSLRVDNPLLNQGVSIGYDQKNNDIYLTYNNTWTLAFNEFMNEFSSFYSYNSPIYIWNKEKLLTIDTSNKNNLWETHGGAYNSFYGVNQESNITLVANPEAFHECIYNNIEWKSVAVPQTAPAEVEFMKPLDTNYTWERVRIWNEFQDSEEVTITKLRKLNRKYRMALPRDAGGRDRIRSNWAFIKLMANNTSGYFYVNQPILLYYIPNYIMIQ